MPEIIESKETDTTGQQTSEVSEEVRAAAQAAEANSQAMTFDERVTAESEDRQ